MAASLALLTPEDDEACLHDAGFYTEERVEAAEALKLPGALCLLLNERSATAGDK